MKISSDKQLKRDIKYLKKQLDDNKDAIDEILEHIEKVGIGSAEYFCEEFVFILSLIHISDPRDLSTSRMPSSA